MHPTTQPQQHQAHRQERWNSDAPYGSAGPSGTVYVPLPAAAPALPPPRPTYLHSATSPMSPSSPRPSQPSRVPSVGSPVPASLRPQQPLSHAPLHPAQQPLPARLVNPYEEREERMTHNGALQAQHRPGSTRLSFGPGDPLFSAHQAATASSHPSGPPPLSPRPHTPISPSSLPVAYGTPQMLAQRAPSSGPSNTRSRSASNNASVPPHGAPGHDTDDCPGCRAEMDDAIQVSLRSAQQEDERRHREEQEQQELQRIYAANAEENDRQRRLAQEEEQLLQKAIEDSRRDAEEQSQRNRYKEELLLEESRQYELRQREQSAKLEAQMLEAAKLASSEQEEQTRRERDAMHDAEKRALHLSLQEQEEEWARRESAERSLLEFLDQRRNGDHLASSSGSSKQPQASTSSAAAEDLDAEYWRFAGHDEAYQLALQMQRASLADSNARSRTSTSRTRRPLPRTPEAQERTDETGDALFGSARKQDRAPSSSQPATLYTDTQDAPPAYSEAAQPGPSNSSTVHAPAARPPEKAPPTRYDAATLANLSRPVLQHRSSSSSSAYSHSQGSDVTQSPRASFGGASQQSLVSPPSTSAEESSSAPQSAAASPSIPQRGSSHSTPASKRFSTSSSSIAPEQRGQRALAGLDFGYCSLPFSDKLDRSPLPSSQSSSTLASASSASGSTSTSSTSKALFPAAIELSSVTKKSTSDAGLPRCSFFVLRAHSWKSLLRAIAWYGNSRVEAAPGEVAAASDRRSHCLLRAEVEFVTPTRVDMGYGVGEYARAAQNTGSMPKNPSPAHVALCLSLLPLSASKSSSSGEASAWLKSEEYQIIKRESRRLDAWYAGRGSTRRLIQLARQPPALPVVMVQIAQLLHASHTFSAACPSSGSTARHSPRDLHHAIERHDEGFVRKQQAMLTAGSALAAQSGTGTPLNQNPRLSMQGPSRTSVSSDLHGDDELDDDDDDDEVDFNDFSLLADGSFDAQDKVLMGKRQRLKAKVKRRLAKRASDGRVVDEDLAAWITPFDLSQHG
ncbi:conserved hypothetical protein [Sporisorium reilianum SRZ2]|uniref:Uncharacterized protein n=1 Tax=Sporisorium reilianum (strain SRZ2) TaxID=999809 RepID=E6ZSU4_SPORE|nr:conserved hypothetical protein [Sporisorium reilianum SRZ2]